MGATKAPKLKLRRQSVQRGFRGGLGRDLMKFGLSRRTLSCGRGLEDTITVQFFLKKQSECPELPPDNISGDYFSGRREFDSSGTVR